MYAQLDADYNANKDAVIEMLIKNVMSVNIEIPKVVRGDFEEAEDKQWSNDKSLTVQFILKITLNQQYNFKFKIRTVFCRQILFC